MKINETETKKIIQWYKDVLVAFDVIDDLLTVYSVEDAAYIIKTSYFRRDIPIVISNKPSVIPVSILLNQIEADLAYRAPFSVDKGDIDFDHISESQAAMVFDMSATNKLQHIVKTFILEKFADVCNRLKSEEKIA